MSGAHVFIDRTQFPENVRCDLIESLRTRTVNHKFHYESYKQAAKWLRLHESYSPARHDPTCVSIYDEAFQSATRHTRQRSGFVHVIGLGCGGGQKEARLLEILRAAAWDAHYTASDSSLPLVLTARAAATHFVDETNCRAVVCDLVRADLTSLFLDSRNESRRIITLFGIIPNFEPIPLLSRISLLLSEDDLLLTSANLAPGADYASGVRAIVPQYDNELTRDWLFTFLADVGFKPHDGELDFVIEADEQQLLRITAFFELKHSRDIRVFDRCFCFNPGERIRLFFSYRHTSETIRSLMQNHGIAVESEWLNESGEEGVFLCRKSVDGPVKPR